MKVRLSFRRAALSAAGFLACAALVLPVTGAARETRPSGNVDWPSYNNDLGSQRYSPLTQITASNVSGLHVACSAQLGVKSQFESGPIVVNGVLYVTTLDRTYAFDAATCRQMWMNRYVLPKGSGGANRGVAFANGRLYRGTSTGHVFAIDATSGKTVWDRSVVASGSYEYIGSAPIAWRNALFIGTAGGDTGQMGHLMALDQSTGSTLWTLATVPKPGSKLAKTWQGASRIAGGSMWTSYSLDTATGKLYVPVGNPGPDFDVRKRRGANLYTDSIWEIDASTGTWLRAVQAAGQDDHDWDMAATPAIVTLSGGAKLALAAGKDGLLRAIDITSFAENWETAITTRANTTAPITVAGTRFCPGTKGGVLWNGPAYSPATGLAYVNAVDWCSTVDLSPKPQPYVPGQLWLGSTNYFGKNDPTYSGWLSAVDAQTGATAWSYHAATPLVSGVTATAGGLVFSADLKGNVFAFDAATGAIRWQAATGLAVGGGIVTYAVAGKQYLAVAAGMSSSIFGTPKVDAAVVVFGT